MIHRNHLYGHWGKRVLDILTAGSLLLLASPLLLGLIVAVRLALGAPVFFVQARAGLHGAPFRMVKFRSMRNALGPDGQPLPDAERLTRFGRFLRASSLDELPELWNVLKGDMSLIGPRPLLLDYLPYYTPEEARRHEVRPGITGLAQVSGRNALSWEEKFAYDVRYVDTLAFGIDLQILWLTALKVLHREGIAAEGHATMSRFDDYRTRVNNPNQLT